MLVGMGFVKRGEDLERVAINTLFEEFCHCGQQTKEAVTDGERGSRRLVSGMAFRWVNE